MKTPKETTVTDLTELGLTGLARAGRMGWFPGHFGAAVLTARFLQDSDLPEGIRALVEKNARDIVAEFPKVFAPFPEEPVLSDGETPLLQPLRAHLETLTHSGHGVIYASLALKALRARPDLARPSLVEGIRALLAFAADRGTRYHGIDDYKQVSVGGIPYSSLDDLIRRTFKAAETVYPDDDRIYFSGEKLHAFTFAKALKDLMDLGYGDLARLGFESHRKHLVLSDRIPEPAEPKRFTDEEIKAFSPYVPSYWVRDHFDDHALKFAYAVLDLKEAAPSAYAEDVWVKFAR